MWGDAHLLAEGEDLGQEALGHLLVFCAAPLVVVGVRRTGGRPWQLAGRAVVPATWREGSHQGEVGQGRHRRHVSPRET